MLARGNRSNPDASGKDIRNVILIGGNHHNGLGLARSFGRHGIRPYGIIVEPGGNSFVARSKYWADVELLDADSQIVPMLIGAHRYLSNEKTVVIPWSDAAAKAIDENLNDLGEHFTLPSIGGGQGEIVRLMDKAAQIGFMAEYGIDMLPSEIVGLEADTTTSVPLPVILKPVMSVEGGKSDMKICRNENEYASALAVLRSKGFKRILAQAYMPEREEYVVDGAVTDCGNAFSVARRIRQWPMDFGTGSFSELVVDADVDAFVEGVLEKIADAGYRGPIDLEFFADPMGALYVNEVNWRSSGRNFVSCQTNVHAAYKYFCSIVGIPYDNADVNEARGFSMNELNDFKHVLKRNVTALEWVGDVRKAGIFAVWDKDDPVPFVAKCTGMARKLFSGKAIL